MSPRELIAKEETKGLCLSEYFSIIYQNKKTFYGINLLFKYMN